jgi:AcrR family transcriptional regulator
VDARAKRRRRAPEVAEREILDAARAFLADHDFRELSVHSLMAALGRPRSSFYHYFADLGAVMIPLLDEAQVELLEAGKPWLSGAAEGPAAIAEALLKTSEVWMKHRGVLLAVHDGAAHEPILSERYRGVIDEWGAVVAERLEAEPRSGRITLERPAEVAAALTIMNINVLVERLGRRSGDSPAAVSRVLSQIWVSTIYADHGGGERTRA